jgi:hypothetical protein
MHDFGLDMEPSHSHVVEDSVALVVNNRNLPTHGMALHSTNSRRAAEKGQGGKRKKDANEQSWVKPRVTSSAAEVTAKTQHAANCRSLVDLGPRSSLTPNLFHGPDMQLS